jgi:hypothetical protein
MLAWARDRFNQEFTEEQYRAFVDAVTTGAGVPIEFRLSETPCFFPSSLLDSLVEAAQVMTRQLLNNAAYRTAADAMVPERFRLANGETLPTCVQVDFGLVRTDSGAIEGRLVELQAFPSLYGFQMLLAETALGHLGESGHLGLEGDGSRSVAGEMTSEVRPQRSYGHRSRPVPLSSPIFTPYLSGLNRDSYSELLRRTLVGEHDPASVILMEIEPRRQKTLPDFTVTENTWGIRPLDTREIIREGRRLFYKRDGVLTPIVRIYNRVIPDELERSGAPMPFDYRDDLDVEWIGGPDWFFRISKFSIPWITHPWVPETHFLSNVKAMPDDRDEWLLKPLFSFAGGGIIFSPTNADIAAIPDDQRHLYVLQRRVAFTPLIRTPAGDTQAELRIMMVREGDGYRAVMPLVRMGRGKMMGVDHNKGLRFVGASAALMEMGN